MNALLAEIAAKRKAIDDDPPRPTKYMRRGDIDRLKQEEERAAQAREEQARKETEAAAIALKASTVSLCSLSRAEFLFANGEQVPSRSATNSPHPLRDIEEPKPEAAFNISNEETVRRLRSKGQPIRLFAESDKDRRLRLRALELIEEKGHDRQGGQNDFKKALEDVENVEREMKNKSTKGKKREDAEQAANSVLDLSLIKSDPDKLYPIIYFALKRTLREWGEAMDERPGAQTTYIPLMYSLGGRKRQADDAGQAGCCYSGTVGGLPEAPLQNTACTSESHRAIFPVSQY
jgi:pre-mRNA-splicing factor 18